MDTILIAIGAFVVGCLLTYIIVRPVILKSKKAKILQEAEKEGEDIKKREDIPGQGEIPPAKNRT